MLALLLLFRVINSNRMYNIVEVSFSKKSGYKRVVILIK